MVIVVIEFKKISYRNYITEKKIKIVKGQVINRHADFIFFQSW